jgi:hypothetical protein
MPEQKQISSKGGARKNDPHSMKYAHSALTSNENKVVQRSKYKS